MPHHGSRHRSRHRSHPSPAHRSAARNAKRNGNYASFVAPRDARGRVMVVRNRYTGQWMLPGGLANYGEDAHRTGVREMWEETGMRAQSPYRVQQRRGVSLYDTGRSVSRSHAARVNAFRRRTSRNETDDYGFVDLRDPHLTVTSYTGKSKPSPHSFRPGTVSHLRAL